MIATDGAITGPNIAIERAPLGLPPGGFEKEEGGIFDVREGGLIVAGVDDAGLTAAADAYAARAPYIWRTNGEKLSAIAEAIGGNVEPLGVTYHARKGRHSSRVPPR